MTEQYTDEVEKSARSIEQLNQGLTVTTSGLHIINRWLKQQEQIAQKPQLAQISQGGPKIEYNLPLGTLELNDQTLTILSSGIVFNMRDFGFEISTFFLPFRVKNTSSLNPFSFTINSLQNPENNFVNFEEFTQLLNESAKFNNCSYEYTRGYQGELIKINSTQGVFEFHAVLDQFTLGFNYCLHKICDNSEMSEDMFKQFGDLTQQFANTFYELTYQNPPSQEFSIAPQKNAEKIIDSTDEYLKTQKRMLSITGLEEGGEDLRDEIKGKIELIERPKQSFNDVGGLTSIKEELETVVYASKHPEAFARWGSEPPNGILLYGEPGTGKTLLAKAIAHEADRPIFVVTAQDIKHSLYGRSERMLDAVFQEANLRAPAFIFLDEIDALAPHRDYSTEVASGIVSVFLTNLDGLKETNTGVILIAATNRLDAIDKALLRPGRFDLTLEVPVPDEKGRAEILKIIMRLSIEKSGERQLYDPSLNIEEIVKKTPKFTGSDLNEINRYTLSRKVIEEAKGGNPTLVTTQDYLDTIQRHDNTRTARRKARGGWALSPGIGT